MIIPSKFLPKFKINEDLSDNEILYSDKLANLKRVNQRFGYDNVSPENHLCNWVVTCDYDNPDCNWVVTCDYDNPDLNIKYEGLSGYIVHCNSDVYYRLLEYIKNWSKP